MERPIGQLSQVAAVGVHDHQVPIRGPVRHRTLIGPVCEIDLSRIEIGHGVTGNSVGGVEQGRERRG